MSGTKLIPLASRCSGCRHHTLSSFARINCVAAPRAVASSRRLPVREVRIQRSFTHSAAIASSLGAEKASSTSDDMEMPETAIEEENVDKRDTRPWYLRENEPQAIPREFLERYEIPKIPEDCPDRLGTILECLSKEIGLERLSLLDLRALDPPAALGSNLIMVLGTARSPKHLHVSADRFSRWLRSNYKLRPYSDGLLGRDELKRRERRRRKKEKLLSRARASSTDRPQDDSEVDWICVNVGPIEKMVVKAEQVEEEGVVGFGTRDQRINLVVQMLTESKRELLNLEELWTKYLQRQIRKGTRDEEVAKSSSETGVPQIDQGTTVGEIPERRSAPLGPIDSHFSEQRRSFHILARRASVDITSRQPSAASLSLDEGKQGQRIPLDLDSDSQTPQSLINYLRTRSLGRAKNMLGDGWKDVTSTHFLRTFYASLPEVTNIDRWELLKQLIEIGLWKRHPGYSRYNYAGLLAEMQLCMLDIPVRFYELALEALLRPKTLIRPGSEDRGNSYTWDFVSALDILQDASLRGLKYISASTTIDLMLGAARFRHHVHSTDNPRKSRFVKDYAVDQLTRTLEDSDAYLLSEEQTAKVLDELAVSGAWEDYWACWRAMARRMERRSEALYASMFKHVAALGLKKEAADALHEWIPEMSREEPEVQVEGDVSRGIMGCLLVAEPTLSKTDVTEARAGQWESELWNRCRASLGLDDKQGSGPDRT